MNADIASEDQPADLTEGALFELDVHVHSSRPPAAHTGHALPVRVRQAIGAAGLAREAQIPVRRPARAGDGLEVHVLDIENGFRVAEFEIDVGVPHRNPRKKGYQIGREHGLEVPVSRTALN